jgi:hypothetical protein
MGRGTVVLCATVCMTSLVRADERASASAARHLRNAGIVTVALGAAAMIVSGAMIGHYTRGGCGDGNDDCLAALPAYGAMAAGGGAVLTGIGLWAGGQSQLNRAGAVPLSAAPTSLRVEF